MKIAVCQINPMVADLTGNARKILDTATEAAALNPDLIVFPEMSLTGCHPLDILFDRSFVNAATAVLEDITDQSNGLPPIILGSVGPANDGERLHNAAFLLNGGTCQMVSSKQHLPTKDVYSEPRWFEPGPTPGVFSLGGKQISVLVGGEIETFQPGPEADVIISLAASPFFQGQHPKRHAYALTHGCPVVYANLVGGNDYLIFDGGSFTVNVDGELIAQLDHFTEQVKLVDLDSSPIPDIPVDEIEHLNQALSLGIQDFADKNGIQRAFIGLSGGIDSAVVACLAAAGLGADRVTGIAMPSRYTDPRSTQSAEELANNIGIGFEVFAIEEMHKSAESSLAKLLDEGTGAENLQARLRMIVLMGYVNRYGGMLLNTGNKTEASLGYATLYGDTAGSLCPIGDLTKPQVYQLANWINGEEEVIPPFSIERAPTAELRPGQLDPFDYDDLSPKLEALVQANQSSPAMRAAEHKRDQMGVILKVSQKSFGPGRMIPITRK